MKWQKSLQNPILFPLMLRALGLRLGTIVWDGQRPSRAVTKAQVTSRRENVSGITHFVSSFSQNRWYEGTPMFYFIFKIWLMKVIFWSFRIICCSFLKFYFIFDLTYLKQVSLTLWNSFEPYRFFLSLFGVLDTRGSVWERIEDRSLFLFCKWSYVIPGQRKTLSQKVWVALCLYHIYS
jgi:hypothetical protein